MKVKRANVPDLPDTVSWSGHLLGINKINLTKENRTRREREERQSPQIFGCEMKQKWAIGFSGTDVLIAKGGGEKEKETICQHRPRKAQVGDWRGVSR